MAVNVKLLLPVLHPKKVYCLLFTLFTGLIYTIKSFLFYCLLCLPDLKKRFNWLVCNDLSGKQ